jgi:hypothetical protein
MQKILPATALLLGAGFTVISLYNLAGTAGSRGQSPGVATAPQLPAQPQNAPASGDPAQLTRVDFQDSQPLTMASEGPTKYQATVFLRNDEPLESTLQFSLALEDSQKQVLSGGSRVSAAALKIDANSIAPIRVQIDTSNFSAPLSGYLQLTAKSSSDRKPSIKYRALKIPPPMPSASATALFWVSLGGTALVAVGGILLLMVKDKIWVSQRMGSPTWNFGDSWGTNIAVGGALLNTLVTFSALPDQTHYLNKISYVCLSMIFGAVITVAPSLYALVRTAVVVPVPGGNPAIQYQGYVGCFALASAVIAWGAIGQLVTVAFLLLELWSAKTISVSVLSCLATVLGIVGVLLLVYEGRTIVQTARLQKAAAAAAAGGGAPAGVNLPSWSLL